MNAHTPTEEVAAVYDAKSDLLREWEAQPPPKQARNAAYIAALTRRVRKLRTYLTHRKDSPL